MIVSAGIFSFLYFYRVHYTR